MAITLNPAAPVYIGPGYDVAVNDTLGPYAQDDIYFVSVKCSGAFNFTIQTTIKAAGHATSGPLTMGIHNGVHVGDALDAYFPFGTATVITFGRVDRNFTPIHTGVPVTTALWDPGTGLYRMMSVLADVSQVSLLGSLTKTFQNAP